MQGIEKETFIQKTTPERLINGDVVLVRDLINRDEIETKARDICRAPAGALQISNGLELSMKILITQSPRYLRN